MKKNLSFQNAKCRKCICTYTVPKKWYTLFWVHIYSLTLSNSHNMKNENPTAAFWKLLLKLSVVETLAVQILLQTCTRKLKHYYPSTRPILVPRRRWNCRAGIYNWENSLIFVFNIYQFSNSQGAWSHNHRLMVCQYLKHEELFDLENSLNLLETTPTLTTKNLK